ncbi:MAG TPA: hypothetical protein VM010_00435 [Chitinophagaceae bacterium]|nr:hypothetical protein [Chitinophagaceae bacterium]
MKHVKFLLSALCFSMLLGSCEKDAHVPPNVSLKTGTGYTSADATVSKGASIMIGFTADKTEDELKTFNISKALDNAATTETVETFTLTGGEEDHYEKDYMFTTRNQAGTEKWIFTITDRDGNIAQKQVVLTVQ